jgi:hypothetical protein
MTIADIHANAVLIFAATKYSDVELKALSDEIGLEKLGGYLSDQYKEHELARVNKCNDDFYPDCRNVERF